MLEHGRLVGLLDESDVLNALHFARKDSRASFSAKVADAMVTALNTLPASAPIDALLPVFERNEVAIVMDGEDFVGLVTRMDLINHVRLAP